jgi:proteasome accessory factor A
VNDVFGSPNGSHERPGGVPKLCGADAELGNFVLGVQSPEGSSSIASRLLLREIDGLPQNGPVYACGYSTCAGQDGLVDLDAGGVLRVAAGAYNPQDWGRKFLRQNGGCAYIDLNHLELCIPEVISAYDYVAAWHAMLRIAAQAQRAANARLRPGLRIEVLVNNSDGLGNSYGSHLNFLVSRRLWDQIFRRRPHYLTWLASFQVSSIVITGQGKVGAENDTPRVDYQISQRADFFETLFGLQTTYRRPIVNTRDEPLCGAPSYGAGQWDSRTRPRSRLARLHVIFYDSNLCHVACLLKVGMMQIVLAMLEAGEVNPQLMLEDPLESVVRWSHDPSLKAASRLAGGRRLTAVEMQLMFLEEAGKFIGRGGCEGCVPRAGEILALWTDTLEKLRAGDLDALTGRLDWVLKLRALEQVLRQRPDLSWSSRKMKHLDHVYASLEREDGLYWAYEEAGATQRVATPAEIDALVHEPPADTRAWTRAMMLRLASSEQIQHLDWDSLSFKGTSSTGWPHYRTLGLPNPLELTRAEAEPSFCPGRTLEGVLDALSASRSGGYVSHTTWTPVSSHSYQQVPALLPAPQDAVVDGGETVAVYDYDRFPEDLDL